MLRWVRGLFDGKAAPADDCVIRADPTGLVECAGLAPFDVEANLTRHLGFPLLDWDAARAWADLAAPDEEKGAAWSACERAWLLHLRGALGPGYSLAESGSAALLSALGPGARHATLAFMARALKRIARVLDGLARVSPWGRDILIVFDDAGQYYSYVSCYYPEEGGEFALCGGMYLDRGCGHFATVKTEMHAIEPVIAHEMTHGCLAHLPLPLWLNEGIAVNTERRVATPVPALYTPMQMHEKHLAFWGEDEIQAFWSGESFRRTDEGNALSYDLARILVELFAKDWPRFRAFALAADARDGGGAAAASHLATDLGSAVCALLERPEDEDWSPDPGRWEIAAAADRPKNQKRLGLSR